MTKKKENKKNDKDKLPTEKEKLELEKKETELKNMLNMSDDEIIANTCMCNFDNVAILQQKLDFVISQFIKEFDVDYPTLIGVLETLKLNIYEDYMEQLYRQQEGGDGEEGGDDENDTQI